MPYTVKNELNKTLSDIVLRSGKTAEFNFDSEGLNLYNHHRLYFTCEDKMYPSLKDEPYGDKLYQLIEDSLDTENAMFDRYCLNMSEETPRPFLKCAAIKLVWGNCVNYGGYGVADAYTENWNFGIFAKANNLKIHDGGFLRFRLERWALKPGVDPHHTGLAPDDTYFVDINEGSFDYTEFAKEVTLPLRTSGCVLITLEGLNYSGEVYFERPHLTSSIGDNVLVGFDVAVPCKHEKIRELNWLGMNLAKKEWPRFKIELNGKTFFEGEKFIRIHRYSPIEIDIPSDLLAKDNNLKITYTSNYRDTVPVAIREVKILEKPKAPFHIHFCPSVAVMGKDIALLIETEQNNMSFTLKSEQLTLTGKTNFEDTGLHVITLTGKEYFNNMQFALCSNGYEVNAAIPQAVVRYDDNVTIGSGDMIYIDNSDLKAVCDYFEWALNNKTHNAITVRPAYRWGGQRTVNPKVWQVFTNLCNELGIDYAHMTDGRDLPGIACNPSPEMLKGERFLGVQHHERDGQVFYWSYKWFNNHPISDTFFDLCHRLYRETPETTFHDNGGHNTKYNEVMRSNRYFECEPDMKQAHANSIKALKQLKKCPRHTGPSVMFKYFYEVGFDWLGAETMDSSTEVLISFMRGATKAYGKNSMGVHHAVQWSTRPHDTNERYRRFMLANYVSYLQGVTEINTEEGLWFLESQYNYHNRFSPACENHVKMQKRIYDFIVNHSRTGEIYVPTAFIHGRYDGWYGFAGSSLLFGMPSLPKGEAEKGWKLLNVFYPLNKIDEGGVVGYYPENHGKPIGLLSGNPNGNVDVTPIEVGNFKGYKFLAFAGYNAAEAGDMDNLLDFVKNGGTLLATIPHFATNTARADIDSYNLNIIDHEITRLMFNGTPAFEGDVCTNLNDSAVTIKADENGLPLVVEFKVGNGKIVLVNKLKYPGNADIMPLYSGLVKELNLEVLKQDNVNVICDETVQFAKYIQADGSEHIYITPVDWYNNPDTMRTATLKVGDNAYNLELKFGEITKIVAKGSLAVWPKDSAFEVLSAEPIKVQGVGETTVYVAKDGKITEKNIKISNTPIIEL